MEFIEALQKMEEGKKIKRPDWQGYLFMDIDNKVKLAGNKIEDEKKWQLDTYEKDWEESMDTEKNNQEITEARLEALMDESACNIKRLYFLEEIMEGQHKAMKKIIDNATSEMDETRKQLSIMVKFFPDIKENIKNLLISKDEIKSQRNDIKKLKTAIDDLIKKTNKISIKDKEDKDKGNIPIDKTIMSK